MSLINKVLIDLDRRRAVDGCQSSNTEDESPLKGLPFSVVPQTKTNRFRYVLLGGSIVVLVISAGAGLYFYSRPASEKMASNPVTPVLQDNNRVTSKPTIVKVPKQAMPGSKVKQTVAIRPPPLAAVTKPVNNITQRSQSPIVKNKPKKTIPIVVLHDPESEFNKNTIPLRAEQRAEVAYQSAYDQLKVRNQRKAEQLLRQALALEPVHIKSRELLSGVYIKQGRWIEASELLQHGLDLSPRHRTFRKLYARTLMQLQQDRRAITVLRQYAPTIKSDPEYYAILAVLYQRQKDHVSAVQTYKKIVAIQPGNGVWWVGLGISLEALGESQQASQAYFQARKSGNLQNEIARFTNNRLVVLDEIGYPVH